MKHPRTLQEVAARIAQRAEPNGACIRWTGPVMRDGYAKVGYEGGNALAHRIVYMAKVGPIAPGLTVDHLCHNWDRDCRDGVACPHRSCVNPDHLEAVSGSDNTRRAKARISRCPQGHPYDEANTYRRGTRRFCRACGRAATARLNARKKAVA